MPKPIRSPLPSGFTLRRDSAQIGRGWSERTTRGMPNFTTMNDRNVQRDGQRWWILDAKGLQLAEAAQVAAYYVMGHNRPDFASSIVMGDNVVVTNIKDVVMVGDTWTRGHISWNDAWPSGKYRVRNQEMYERDPCLLFFNEVRKSVAHYAKNLRRKPEVRLGPLEFLYPYEDAVHPHADKNPRPILWQSTGKNHYYENKHLQRRWEINDFMV